MNNKDILIMVVDSQNDIMGIYQDQEHAEIAVSCFEGSYKCRIVNIKVGVWSGNGWNNE